jgi:Sulfotransferase domain
MALQVVGAGLGRTGTKSLQTALNTLGLGPCHHMVEVFAHPESRALWIEAGAGRPDWDVIFKDYRSMVDYPGAAFWRELAAYYPNAKVLLSVRDPDQWFDSTQATIFAPGGGVDQARDNPDTVMAAFFRSFSGTIRDNIHDRAWMTAYFRRHADEVRAAIPPERLLVYEAGSGWEPLCAFFGLPVPDAPYPSENNRAEFQARVAAMNANASAS